MILKYKNLICYQYTMIFRVLQKLLSFVLFRISGRIFPLEEWLDFIFIFTLIKINIKELSNKLESFKEHRILVKVTFFIESDRIALWKSSKNLTQ